ncbi:PCMD domain-containing protein [Prevotella sp. E13-27]|uniref:PCMD domain-containing protein n=1 Tax=Prevotella sp. E13-27 TaxID=2938122 RepID=UPI00200A1750|nr:PCMD domain-containing protein [Prevotella sp. E13-27]MCK8621576.1 fibrobacter succinogenes major paralogous domain-containing protein [Prevotella sp. E13-27]
MSKNKLLLLLALLLTAATGAWAQTEITTIPNGDFETWTYDGEDMPNYWNSNATSDGSLAAMSGGKQLKRSTDVRPGSSGQYSCSIWSKSTMGVINIGILTSGRIHFGSMSSIDKANYIYSDRDGSNTKNNFTNPCAMPFTGKPTAIKVWVKYVQGGTGYGNYATAKFSATIHGDADYVAYNLAEHDNDNNKALVVASAEQEIAYNNGEWEQITIPFNYTDNDVAPAYILINAYTNAYPGKGKANDYLYIDDIELEYAPEPGIASTYTVSLKDGVKDADKWTVKVGEGEAQALPIGGLKGDGSETVTLQYNGRLKVKCVKATSEAAPAEASVPDGAINGKFSVSDGKQVYFSKGNLRYASGAWSFFDNQYDYYTSYSADAWDHFGWSTSATDYGKNTSTTNSDYSGDFVDWGATMGTGWRTLTSDEWTYLLNTRSASSVGGTDNGRYAKAKVNDVPGVILFPDTYTHPDGVNAPTGVNATGDTGWNGNSYTAADWTKMESAGCVFLPAAGMRIGTSMGGLGSNGYYWSATPNGPGNVYDVYISSGSLVSANFGSRIQGLSVRLVQEATTDAAPAKPAATVTTAPTGAAIVGVGKGTALVSGGVADGGTLWYAVTTTNTKPASTDGFSDKVPTAETITASGTVYVWYYVKADDDTHSDSEIAATAIEVPVADIVWDATNVTDIDVEGTYVSYTKEGITLSANDGEDIYAMWADNGDPKTDGISFQVYALGGFTFTAPTGKEFTKIEMNAQGFYGWNEANLGVGWTYFEDETKNIYKVTWTGSAASTDKLLPLTEDFIGENVKSIGFYLVDAE